MSRIYIPSVAQKQMLGHAIQQKRPALFASMGIGKTSATLTHIAGVQMVDPRPALVLAPLRVAAGTWPDEAAKWAHLSGMVVSPVVGTKAQRIAALSKRADVYTTNYESLPWLVEHLGGQWPFGTIVADESTRLKSFRTRQGGKRASALAKVAWESDRFIELTGTPAPNGLMDLWGQLWFLDRGKRLGSSFNGFQSRWFYPQRVGQNPHAVKWNPLPNSEREIHKEIGDICLSLDARDYFDIDEPVVNVVRVPLPSKARRVYEDMEREMYVALGEDEGVEAFNAAAKTIKCLQIANGALYREGQPHLEVHNAKLDALESVVNEANGMPVLVAYHFVSDAERILRAFPQAKLLDKDPQTVRDFNAGKIPMLLAHPASAGHGLNLADATNILAVFGHWWDLEQYQQIIERIGPTRQKQAGYDRPTFIYQIVAEDTVDELVIKRRETKRAVQDLLLDAVKRK